MSPAEADRTEKPPRGWRWWTDGPRATGLVWAGMVAVYLAVVLSLSYKAYDGDDLMRLQQVRDLLGGQSWFDVTQYRMNPPDGAAMHWSRLVDIPLAGMILLLRLFMPDASAEFWAIVFVPLIYLGAALLLLRAIMLRLGLDDRQVLVGLGLAALFPLLPAAFAPMRIDHHSPQALAALAGTLLLVSAPDRRAALLSGLAAATWLVISLEGLPVIALLAAIYGLLYAMRGDRSLAWFLGALALAAPLLSLATRPLSEFGQWCDILLPAHWAAFAAGAAIAAILPLLPGQALAKGRMAALILLPLACGPIAFSMLGQCTAGPFATLDPFLRTNWYDHIHEGLPVWQQTPSFALPAIYTTALIPAGLWAAQRSGLARENTRTQWLLLALLAFGTALYGLYLMREMLIAQLLAVPFAVALFVRFMPGARAVRAALPRVLATMACLLLITPAGAALTGLRLGGSETPASHIAQQARVAAQGFAHCDFSTLAVLPQGHVFATFDNAPAILADTLHTVEVGGYHRNTAGLHRVIAAFASDARESRAIVKASGADYLAACLEDDSLSIFGSGKPGSLAALILNDDAPDWLVPVSGFADSQLRVYRVR